MNKTAASARVGV